MSEKPILYFLCTGNSCRSQMAEGFGKKYLSDKWDVRSAGIEAHGLNKKAIEVMNAAGVPIDNQQSNIIKLETLHKATLVVTLCEDAKDRCPMTPPDIRTEHWGFPDPAQATGTEEEINQIYECVRNGIKEKIMEFKIEEMKRE